MSELISSQPDPGYLSQCLATFEGVEQLAAKMAQCATLPSHLAGSPGDCFRVVVQAASWGMDPFMVAEKTSVVHGRLCYEGTLIHAALMKCGAITGPLDFKHTGSGQDMGVTVTGTLASGETKSLTGSVTNWRTHQKDKKTGKTIPNNWDKDPHSMLCYRGARQWARLFAPQVLLGVNVAEDIEAAAQDADFVVIQDEPAPVRDRKPEPEPGTDPQHTNTAIEKPAPTKPANPNKNHRTAAERLRDDTKQLYQKIGGRQFGEFLRLWGSARISQIRTADHDDVRAAAQELEAVHDDNAEEVAAWLADQHAKRGVPPETN